MLAPFAKRPALPLLLLVCLTLHSPGEMTPPTPAELAALPPAPESLAPGVLSPSGSPRLVTREDLERGRRNVAAYPWAQRYLAGQKALCDRFAAMGEEELRALVPPPGSLYILGLGMNLDPLHGSKMVWAGWEKPFSVKDASGALYPSDEWPDSGAGFLDPKSKKRFFFAAIANAARVNALEREILPALADVHALTGSQAHARAAAVLLDALAAAYPGSIRGPLDYPMGKELRRYGGRLNRPTQQVARGVASYAQAIDLVAASGELEAASHFGTGGSIRENIARNLLRDGGNYCLLFARQLKSLGNGMADFNYGAAVAGLLLEEPEYCKPLLSDSKSIYQMLRNNLARQAFYFEASPGYEFFTLELYLRSAELIEVLRERRMTALPSLYEHPGALRFFTAPYRQREVGGHIPLLGNTRVDGETVDASLAGFPKGDGPQARFRKAELLCTWSVAARSTGEGARNALRALRELGGGTTLPEPFEDRWLVFYYDPAAFAEASGEAASPRESSFEGGKGIALLRGGSGAGSHGLQLFFGPSQVKSQNEALSWTFFRDGAEWSFDPGRYNAHFRFGWCASSVAHQSMVVDREDASQASGSGHLRAFGALPDTQWAMAGHPGVYRERGVTRFERFLAQVQGEAGGDLLYWLDVGRVEGGARREESFHSQMRKVSFTPELPWKKAGAALFGTENLGELVNADYTLKGSKQGFYWTPPGSGYGFLGNPKAAPQGGAVRSTWSAPAFFNDQSLRLIADFPESRGPRELIVADGPKAPSHPRVPYLLRSDSGPGASLFAKVLHFAPASGETGVETVRSIAPPLAKEGDLSGAWVVERRDGVRDLWILNDHAGNRLAIEAPGLPRIETDALAALLRFDTRGALLLAVGEGASLLHVENGPQLSGKREAAGEVEAVESTPEGIVLKIRWRDDALFEEGDHGVQLLNILPAAGQPSTWQLREARGERLYLRDVSDVIGGGKAVVTADGWIEFPQALSRFSVVRSGNAGFAEGKPLFAGERLLGRITEVREDACAIKIDPPLPPGETGDLEIREIAPGDSFRIPLRITWKPAPGG